MAELFGKGGKVRRGAGKGVGKGDGRQNSGSEFDGLVLDDSFIKAATVKEDSARTRQLREQWKKQPPPAAQPWRSWEGEALQHRAPAATGPTAPGPTATGSAATGQPGPAQPGRPGRRRVRRLSKTLIAVVVVLALALGIRNFYAGRHIQAAASAPAINSNLTAMPTANDVRATAAPTGDCLAGEPGCGSMSQPYAGSPAIAWADGAAGIVLPAAAKTGDFTSAQVAAALALSKQFVVDQTLVPDVLVGGAKPSALLGLITPASGVAAQITSWLAAPTDAHDPTGVFVRFDPNNAALLTTPKVSGTVTYSQADGVLQVDLSFKVVYALEKPDGSDWTRTMATVDDELQYYDVSASEPTTGAVWPQQAWISSYAGAQCAAVGGFMEPWYFLDQNGALPGGAVVDPYATSTAPPTPSASDGTCGSVSRM